MPTPSYAYETKANTSVDSIAQNEKQVDILISKKQALQILYLTHRVAI